MKQQLLCRGDGKLYIKVKTNEQLSINSVEANIQLPDCSLVVGCYPFESFGNTFTDVWVLEIPIMELPSVKVILTGASESNAVYADQITVNFERAKWESRLNYRIHRQQCFEIRDYEKSFIYNHYQPRILQFLEGENCVIWRIEIQWFAYSQRSAEQASCNADDTEETTQKTPSVSVLPELQVFDGKGALLHPTIYPFETFITEEGNSNPNSYTFSLELPKDCKYFVMQAIDSAGVITSGFCSVNPGAYESFKYESWKYMKDARADDSAYQSWFDKHRAQMGEWERQAQTRFARNPLISIVVPCYQSNEQFLSEMIDSVLAQSYQSWELLLVDASSESGVVANAINKRNDSRINHYILSDNLGIVGNTNEGIMQAKGEYIAFLDHDDLLEPDALYCYVAAINQNPSIKLLFCDEDMFSKKGTYRQPVFKTKLNVDLLYSHNCVTHFLMIDANYLNQIGLSKKEVSGAQDYDLVLRAYEGGGEIYHVSRVLYHWREHEGSTSGDNKSSKPYAEEAGRIALQNHFDRMGIAGEVVTTEHPYVYKMNYKLPEPLPLVSVVIPNKDHIDELDACIQSLLHTATYENLEIIVVENNSTDKATFQYYQKLQEQCGKVQIITWENEFNYSQIINFGVAHTQGEYVLLLNNDTKVITPNFLQEMLGYAMRKDVGVVGAKLYFRDGLIQHVGIMVGPYGAVAHVHQNYSRTYEGYLARAARPGNFSAVTGACQLVKKSVFNQVNGYEEKLAVGFNDVDFCLKVWQAGYRVVFTPYAELYHYEFTSRGRETFDKAKMYRWKREQAEFTKRWPEYFMEGDPFVNSNLDKDNFYFDLPNEE